VIALLDALGKSRIRFVSHAPRTDRRARRRRLRARDGKPGVLLTHLGPGLTNAATGVANAGARFDPDGRDLRATSSRTTTAAIRTRK
jgi:hypothetical protein